MKKSNCLACRHQISCLKLEVNTLETEVVVLEKIAENSFWEIHSLKNDLIKARSIICDVQINGHSEDIQKRIDEFLKSSETSK